jgi:hypothetical protein
MGFGPWIFQRINVNVVPLFNFDST